jgi:hypothetical protein
MSANFYLLTMCKLDIGILNLFKFVIQKALHILVNLDLAVSLLLEALYYSIFKLVIILFTFFSRWDCKLWYPCFNFSIFINVIFYWIYIAFCIISRRWRLRFFSRMQLMIIKFNIFLNWLANHMFHYFILWGVHLKRGSLILYIVK